jgi:hypothetical protein
VAVGLAVGVAIRVSIANGIGEGSARVQLVGHTWAHTVCGVAICVSIPSQWDRGVSASSWSSSHLRLSPTSPLPSSHPSHPSHLLSPPLPPQVRQMCTKTRDNIERLTYRYLPLVTVTLHRYARCAPRPATTSNGCASSLMTNAAACGRCAGGRAGGSERARERASVGGWVKNSSLNLQREALNPQP